MFRIFISLYKLIIKRVIIYEHEFRFSTGVQPLQYRSINPIVEISTAEVIRQQKILVDLNAHQFPTPI